jgi:predicted enzyme related to lactoylglutathione lyase
MEPVAYSFRGGEVIMEVLSSRVMVHPTDFERSFRFYAENLGLHVYREWDRGSARGVVFFLGGGFLELSGSSRTRTSEGVGLWLQVRDVDAIRQVLEEQELMLSSCRQTSRGGCARCRYETRTG